MKSIIKRAVVLAAGVGILSVAAISSVSAHGIGAAAGSPYDGLTAGCFTAWSGTVTANSNCGSLLAKKWVVPLMVDTQGWKGATFGGSNTRCQLIGSDQLGNSVSSSGWTPWLGWMTGTMSTNQVWVPTAGRLVLECDLSSNGTLTNVNYSN